METDWVFTLTEDKIGKDDTYFFFQCKYMHFAASVTFNFHKCYKMHKCDNRCLKYKMQ